ncbi:MAG: MG2 domain-containing protein, partial [Isosphaeraceae bacterium]
MKIRLLVILGVIGILSMVALRVTWARRWRGDGPVQTLREQAARQFGRGNYKDAFEIFRRLALDPKDDPKRVGSDLTSGVDCLTQLGRVEEADDFREAVIAVHSTNWRLLSAAAVSYFNGPDHEGILIAGRFHRAVYRGGRHVNSSERDRARALQLLVQGLDRAQADPDRPAAAEYLLVLSEVVMSERDERPSWRLQELTPLDRLPDYDDGSCGFGFGNGQIGAPVAADGTPVYYHVPESFALAASDGERWRWALAQAVRLDPSTLNATRIDLAEFLNSEFGTETIAGTGLAGPADGPPTANGPFAIQSLADDETIARLATGIRRFRLPDEFNPIRVYQQVVDEPKTGHDERALEALATIFENRRQLDRAAQCLDRSRFLHGDGDDEKLRHIEQIMLAWGQFQTTRPQPAGRGATLDFRFRNGRRVHFDAFALHEDRLLKHVTDFLATHPPQVDDDYLDVNNIGARVVSMSQAEYLGPVVASWDLDLDPPAGHFDRRISVTTPFNKPGAYLITAKMEGGNTSRIVVWLDDTVIVKKNLAGKAYYFVADALTGRPVPGGDVRLYGWRRDPMGGIGSHAETRELAARADDDGQAEIPKEKLTSDKGGFKWLVTASTVEGRRAHMDFSSYSYWLPREQSLPRRSATVYTITDRPVYRPGATVRFKLWVARSEYDQADASEFAGKTFTVEIHDPKGQKSFTGQFHADAQGGFDGSFELPSDATLG